MLNKIEGEPPIWPLKDQNADNLAPKRYYFLSWYPNDECIDKLVLKRLM